MAMVHKLPKKRRETLSLGSRVYQQKDLVVAK
jgi:hypothetical protein